MKRLKKSVLLMSIVFLGMLVVGCNDPDKLAEKGEYQKAYDQYMKNAQSLEGQLGGQYDTSNLASAKSDAAKLVEQYYKAGEMKTKLGDAAAAQALYQKATKSDYTTTERYPVVTEVWIDAGYQNVWVPGGYEEVWVDGYYEDVWVDGGYEEVWVDGYYDSSNVYHDGYYKKVSKEGYYNKVYREGHYEQKYVDGRYESKWVAGHYEQKTNYKTRSYSFSISSAYVDQAKAKVSGSASTAATTAGSATIQPTQTTADAAAIKTAKDALDAAYQRWVSAGQKTSGTEYQAYVTAKAAYDALVK